MRGSGRDENKRAPMYWSADEGVKGLCDGPKDMEKFDMKYPSLAEQEKDGNSIYHFVKQAILLRNQFPALSHGVVEADGALMEDKSIGAMKKTYGDEEVLLIYNLAAESKIVDLSAVTCMEGELEISGALLTSAEDILVNEKEITMPAYSVIALTEVQ